jgi:hypothetical protein
MPANARLDDAHGWKHRKQSFGFGMLLGPEGTGPAPLWAGFVVSVPGADPCAHTSPSVLFCRPVGVWWVGCGVCGLVGVCELDSGCEHLVVMFCGLFVVCVK